MPADLAEQLADELDARILGLDDWRNVAIREVRFVALRYTALSRAEDPIGLNAQAERIETVQGQTNFVRDLPWLRQYARTQAGTGLAIDRIEADIRRLLSSGFFEIVRPAIALADPEAGRDGGIVLLYELRTIPIAQIRFTPIPRVDTVASLKSLLSLKEGEEYTEAKQRLDIDLIHKERPGIGHVTVQPSLGRNGIVVEINLVENTPIYEIVFTGVEKGDRGEIQRELQTLTLGGAFVSPVIANQDAQRIKAYYIEKGFYFCEVTWRLGARENPSLPGSTQPVLVFDVYEGPEVSLGTVSFNGIDLLIPPPGDNDFFAPPDIWWDLLFSFAAFISDDEVRQRPLLNVLKNGGKYNPERLEQDCRRLEEYVRGHGWLDARVFVQQVGFSDDRKNADIVFKIEPGALYRVRSITIKGDFDARTEEEISSILRVHAGAPFKRLSVEGMRFATSPGADPGDVKRMSSLFRDIGYYYCTVEPEFALVPPAMVDITYTITQGERVRIGRVEVSGNSQTRDGVIRNRLETRPGEWYSEASIQRDTARLMRTQFFGEPPFGVRISAKDTEDPYDKQRVVDIDVRVEEGQTGSFNAGVGFSTNAGLIGFIQITKRNFDITDFGSFTGAGQTISLNLSPGIDAQEQYSLSFSEPFFFGSRFSFDMSGRIFNQARSTYTESDRTLTVGWGYALTPDLILRLTYQLSEFEATDVASNAPLIIKDAQTALLSSTLSVELSLDLRNDIFLPTRGFNIVGRFEWTGAFLGGNVDIWKASIRASLSIPLVETGPGSEIALTFRLAADWAEPHSGNNKIPFILRYSYGGTGTLTTPAMRGFATRGVGPIQDGEHVGGDFRLGGNAELLIPIKVGIIYFVTFFDIGGLADDIDDFDFARLNMSFGFGVRLKLPISPAPLAFDVGFPINAFTGDTEQSVSFTLGFGF